MKALQGTNEEYKLQNKKEIDKMLITFKG